MIWKLLRYTKPVTVPVLENYFRARDRLAMAKLRLQGFSTVVSVENADRLTSDRVIIFATHPTEGIASFHVRFLERWERRGYGIIVACHHPRAEAMLRPLAERGWCVMIRRPFGRDFGCYRDASLMLHDLQAAQGRRFSRVVYCNDSVVTMDTREEGIITFLDSPRRHFAGITDNYDRGYHISSYMFALSGEAFNNPRIHRYWQRYRALSTRRYAIGRGEIGFSRCVIRAGYLAHVQWPLAKLKTRLLALRLDEISRIAESMETHFKATTKHPLQQMRDHAAALSITESPSGSRWFRPGWSQRAALETERSDMEQDFSVPELSSEQQGEVVSRAARDRMIDSIVNYIFRGSHIHHGAAPLLFVGGGLLKKDVVLRRIIEPYNVEKVLMESGACASYEADEILLELVSRGHPKSFKGWRALLLRWDFL